MTTEDYCPECGGSIFSSRVIAPLTLSLVRGIIFAVCQIVILVSFAAVVAIPMAFSPDSDFAVNAFHPVIWGPPAAMLLMCVASMTAAMLTRPPHVLGLSTLWHATIGISALTAAASISFMSSAMILNPGSDTFLGIFFATLLLLGLGSCMFSALSTVYTLLRLKATAAAGRWRFVAVAYFVGALSVILAGVIAALSPGSTIGSGTWFAPAAAAVISTLAAIVASIFGSIGVLRHSFRSSDAAT